MKQVIVVNESLKLPRGKLAAQVAHAAVHALLYASPEAQRAWLQEGMPKVVLRGDSDEELLELEKQAAQLGLPCGLIRDAGRTVVAAGTITCIGLGPAEASVIDQLTGAKSLLK